MTIRTPSRSLPPSPASTLVKEQFALTVAEKELAANKARHLPSPAVNTEPLRTDGKMMDDVPEDRQHSARGLSWSASQSD